MMRIGKVSYELEWPASLASVHQVFHVSMYKKYISDHTFMFPVEGIGGEDFLSYEEVPIAMLDR